MKTDVKINEKGQMLFEGFGESKTAQEWARDLRLSVQSVNFYTLKKGLTVEDLFELTKTKYVPPKQRKPRMGAQMERTLQRMKILLTVSGYIENDEDENDIVVKLADTNCNHAVNFKGSRVGVFRYKAGELKLSGGQGLPLFDMEWEDAKIVQDAEGLWHPHRDTKRILLNKLGPGDEPAPDEYARITEKYEVADEPHRPRAELYEGFSRKYSCDEWAKFLEVDRTTLRRHLKKGETVEEFAKKHKL